MSAAIVVIVVIVVVYWQVVVQWHPIRRCPSCHGSKRNAGSNHERWGLCARCGGTGEVRRFGARKVKPPGG